MFGVGVGVGELTPQREGRGSSGRRSRHRSEDQEQDSSSLAVREEGRTTPAKILFLPAGNYIQVSGIEGEWGLHYSRQRLSHEETKEVLSS